jgi:hypothetical protein
MIKIKKVGTNDYGKWVCFEFLTDLMEISGIARTDLVLEESKVYTNLLLQIVSKTNRNYYKIVEKSK